MGRSHLKQLMRKLLPPPCSHLCNKAIARDISRFHLTCLTCPIRREAYKKTSRYKRYPKVLFVLESASGKGILVPEHYRTYALMIDLDSHLYYLKVGFLKFLMTVAERIAEW